MSGYRDKLVDAMARAIEDANGFSTPVELLADAALDAALGVLAEPSADMAQAGAEAIMGAPALVSFDVEALLAFKAMIAMIQSQTVEG